MAIQSSLVEMLQSKMYESADESGFDPVAALRMPSLTIVRPWQVTFLQYV